ncbi:hypothetical protein EV182_002387 [Spiromyces aspiralis]|uniref:Uncharacterized protein n=1 Tax=Spiromyces aspiralis TaxID=68401 RepID=A0ACC1HZF5_9FUNG|nr:hypothetical protein EV182_002387 [Spiromyces aspiralis]
MASFFLESMDQTIVACALPSIASEFQSFSESNWVPTAYMLTVTAFLPIYGKVSDIAGRAATMVFAILVFVVGSALCGAARSMMWLIIARGLAGLGGGGIVALSSVIITDLIPIERRAKYLSLLSVSMVVSYIIGPSLGGVLTDKVSWRWAFYINIPIGIIAAAVIGFQLRTVPTQRLPGTWKTRLRRVDLLGTLLFVTTMVLLILALTWGGNQYHWRSAAVIAPLCFSAALAVVFIIVELRVASEPAIPIREFTRRNIALLLSAHFLAGIPMFTFIYYMPMYFIVARHATAANSGLYLLPILVGIGVVSLVVSWAVTRLGIRRRMIAVAMAGLALGAGLATLTKRETPMAQCVGILILPGISLGIMFPVVTVGVQMVARRRNLTAITTLVPFAITFAATIGLSVMGTILTNGFQSRIAAVLDSGQAHDVDIRGILDDPSSVWGPSVSEATRSAIIDAFVGALRTIFYVNVGVSLAGLACALGLKRFDPLGY